MRFSTATGVRGRPRRVPFSLARASPALTLSRMMPRSNSAKTGLRFAISRARLAQCLQPRPMETTGRWQRLFCSTREEDAGRGALKVAANDQASSYR